MAIDVVMPQMGESVIEGTVAKWLVTEGERVEEGQPLLEISTDKVDTEIPSPAAGVVKQIVAREGETLPVGARLAVLEEAAGSAPTVEQQAASTKAPAAAAVTAHPIDETESAVGASLAQRAEPQAQPERPLISTPAVEPHAVSQEHRRLSPVVMKIAAEHNIDLAQIVGTGIGGRVTKRDLLNYLESRQGAAPQSQPRQPSAVNRAAEAAPAVTSPSSDRPSAALAAPKLYIAPEYQPREGDIIEPFSRRRKIIAEHMVYSKTHAPHVGIVARVDLTRLARLRDAHKDAFRAREGFSLTFLPMVAMAAIRALKEFPRMNASVVKDSLVIRREINLGVAVDSEEGLVVPVIKSADQKSLLGIAREIEALRRKTVEKRLTADDLAGGSFTVSNPGREGNLFGFAIINQPQVGILRMGEVRKEPVVVERDGEDAIAIRTVMYLTCSYDHRVVDGVLGNRFLYRVARLLEAADFEL
jgi:pyruvate/2-oxoglutarate dehydrogenase complex dihydrolipoamide acyltransferase (E2) component